MYVRSDRASESTFLTAQAHGCRPIGLSWKRDRLPCGKEEASYGARFPVQSLFVFRSRFSCTRAYRRVKQPHPGDSAMRGPFVPHSLDAIVAEQDSSQRSLYADLVREQPGYRLVGEVGSGETLLSFLADEPPQLVVLDFALPGLGGLEGFRKARSDYPRLDWVVLVRPEEPDAIRGAICLGAFDCLIRPFLSSRLRAALSAYRTFHRELVTRRTPWRQDELDHLVGLKRGAIPPDSSVFPKGIQNRILEKVKRLLRDTPGGLSASEAAEHLGMGRSTTRRYLEYLAETSQVTIDFDVAPVGRPSKRYVALSGTAQRH